MTQGSDSVLSSSETQNRHGECLERDRRPESGASGVDHAVAASSHAAMDGRDFITALTTHLTDSPAKNASSDADLPTASSRSRPGYQTTLGDDTWTSRDESGSHPSSDPGRQRHIPMAALPLECSGRVALVGCGENKQSGLHQARHLYASTYFAKKRAFAETLCDSWTICSAKYGLLHPYRHIPEYDITDADINHSAWLNHIDSQLDNRLDNDRISELWVLLGNRYLSITPEEGGASLRDRLDSLPYKVLFPFDETAGIGYQMGWINSCLEQNTAVLPSNVDN